MEREEEGEEERGRVGEGLAGRGGAPKMRTVMKEGRSSTDWLNQSLK